MKLANDAVTKVRRRVIWETEGRRGRKVDPAWANRRRLLTGRERLRPKAFAAMWNGLIDSEPGEVLTAWIAKEELRALLALARTHPDREQIARRLYSFYDWCARADIDELHTLRHHGRDLVAGHRGIPPHRHHQRPNRGTQPPRENR